MPQSPEEIGSWQLRVFKLSNVRMKFFANSQRELLVIRGHLIRRSLSHATKDSSYHWSNCRSNLLKKKRPWLLHPRRRVSAIWELKDKHLKVNLKTIMSSSRGVFGYLKYEKWMKELWSNLRDESRRWDIFLYLFAKFLKIKVYKKVKVILF